METQPLPKKKSKVLPIVLALFVILIAVRLTQKGKTETVETKPQIIFPLQQVSGHTEGEVSKILGEGKFISNWKDKKAGCTQCPKYTYKGDSVEVIYIGDKADRITLNHLSNHNFDKSFITELGLPAAEPDFSNASALRWYNYQNYREIMAFEDGKAGIHYALIKSKAE